MVLLVGGPCTPVVPVYAGTLGEPSDDSLSEAMRTRVWHNRSASLPSFASQCRTPAVSRAHQRERGTSGCWWASGYSRRGNRSPRLCFKTVLASFPAHGSSIVWCL